MRELVDHDETGASPENGVYVHFLKPMPLVFNDSSREHLNSGKLNLCVTSPMSFDDPDQ